jgi:hypothetical protein
MLVRLSPIERRPKSYSESPRSNLGLVKSGNSNGAPILGFRRWDDSKASDCGIVPNIWLKLRSSVATQGDRAWHVGSIGAELGRRRHGAQAKEAWCVEFGRRVR